MIVVDRTGVQHIDFVDKQRSALRRQIVGGLGFVGAVCQIEGDIGRFLNRWSFSRTGYSLEVDANKADHPTLKLEVYTIDICVVFNIIVKFVCGDLFATDIQFANVVFVRLFRENKIKFRLHAGYVVHGDRVRIEELTFVA